MSVSVIFACTSQSGTAIAIAAPSLPFSCDPIDVVRTSMHRMDWIGHGDEARALEELLLRMKSQARCPDA